MNYRQLGKTSLQVSEIGFGAWAIGGDAWGPVEDKVSVAAIAKAIELGVNFLDTADVYGNGHSEELVARAIKGQRDKVIISTKGGLMGHHRNPEGKPVYDKPEKIIKACDDSLRRLATDYIDVYFCHIWWDKPEETEAFMSAFQILKQSGKVRATGVSTEDFKYIRHFNSEGQLDVVQLDFSLLNRKPEKEVLPFLQEQSIGVVVRGPLKKGLLSGKFSERSTFPEGDIRNNWPEEPWFKNDLKRVTHLQEQAVPLNGNQNMGQLALRFVLSHPAISCAIPGAKTIEQVEANVAAAMLPPLSATERRLIDEIIPV